MKQSRIIERVQPTDPAATSLSGRLLARARTHAQAFFSDHLPNHTCATSAMPARPQPPPIPLLLTTLLLAIALPLGSDALNPQAQRFNETRDPLVAAAWKQDAPKVREQLRQAAASGPVTRKNLGLLVNCAAPDLGSPPTKRAMWTPLWAALLSIEASSFSAARSPDALAVVDKLLQAGADPRAVPPPGWTEAPDDTALHYAARLTQNPEIVRLLMVAAAGSAGVGSGGKNNGTTAAASSSSWINQRNSKGNTPLFAAASCDWRVSGGDAAAAKVVRMLLAAGADASVRNKRGCPALEIVPSPCTASSSPQPRYQGAEAACRAFAPLQKRGGDMPSAAQVREAWSRAPSSAWPEGGGGSAFCPETFAVLRAAAPEVRGRDGRVMGPAAGELLMPCDA